MGTRGAYGVVIDNQEKLTYNHSDSYPDGLGEDFVKDLRKIIKKYGLDGFKTLARELEVVDQDSTPTANQIQKYHKYLNLNVHEQTEEDWYCLLRELQGQFAETLIEAKVMVDGTNFIFDSLFCEFAYIANLNTGKFEVYRGFQKSPPNGRYETAPPASNGYYAVGLVAEFPLDAIPKNWIKQAFPEER